MIGNIKFPAKIEYLENILRFVRSCARNEGFSKKRISNIELALEEALANICHHAYTAGTCGDMEIQCRTDDSKRLIIDIIDTGKPFNMLSVSEPDLTGDVANRDLGGLGVLLIRRMVDDIHYSRRDNKNVLTFVLTEKGEINMMRS
jgi:serine/threonine-protein kinase RsbW